MTHTYTVSGMTCKGCAATVKSQLLKHPDIVMAEIDLENEKAVIEMSRHIDVIKLQDAIGTGKYKISEITESHRHTGASSEDASWLETYKPILLIFGFILIVSLLISTREGNFHGMMFMNSFMAGFFLVFSFFKFLDLKGFANSYVMYDVVASKIPVYGYIYPFIELGLGLAYLSGMNPFATNITTIIVMGISSVGVIRSVLNKEKIQCACLGAVFNLPMSTVTIIEDLLMVAMAGIAILF